MLARGAAQSAIAELQEFIDNRSDAREVRKALAVKLVYQGYKYEEIQTILDVSLGSRASYHRSNLVQDFLSEINQDLSSEQWKIHCVRFAPNCPSQNPIEDIWLQAKTWARRFCALIPTFSHLKWMFEWFLGNTMFDFSSLQMYGVFSEIKY
jgi:transposase